MPPNHRLARKRAVSVHDLAGERVVQTSQGNNHRELIARAFPRPASSIRDRSTSTGFSSYKFVVNGIGLPSHRCVGVPSRHGVRPRPSPDMANTRIFIGPVLSNQLRALRRMTTRPNEPNLLAKANLALAPAYFINPVLSETRCSLTVGGSHVCDVSKRRGANQWHLKQMAPRKGNHVTWRQ